MFFCTTVSEARGTLPLLPYKMGLDHPYDCVYTLGHARPGNCVRPVKEPAIQCLGDGCPGSGSGGTDLSGPVIPWSPRVAKRRNVCEHASQGVTSVAPAHRNEPMVCRRSAGHTLRGRVFRQIRTTIVAMHTPIQYRDPNTTVALNIRTAKTPCSARPAHPGSDTLPHIRTTSASQTRVKT